MLRSDLTLADVLTDRNYIITWIDSNVNHLFEFGLDFNVKIKKLFTSPLNNPSAYEVMGTVIALRDEVARQIHVAPLTDDVKRTAV